MRRGGGKKRRDANEPAIVAALEAAGCTIWRLSGVGVPDLLIFTPGGGGGAWRVCEVKTARGRLTAAQVPHAAIVPVVRSVEDALRLIGR